VLVVSAMPAAIYRGIMKALDAWDYLQKATFDEAEFIDTFLSMLRAAKNRKAAAQPAALQAELSLDPLHQGAPSWRGQRLNVPLTAQRILSVLVEHAGEVVSYETLFSTVKSGRTRENIRKHIGALREAFRELDPNFEAIENVPMRGFRWMPK
jgi:DNA-binding response OmpR family regulator